MGVEVADDGTVTITPDDVKQDDVSSKTLETAIEADVKSEIALETAKESEASTKELIELCRMQSQQIADLIQQQTALSSELASIQAQLLEKLPSIEQSNTDIEPLTEPETEISEATLQETSQEPTLVLAETIDTNEISTEASSSIETEAHEENEEGQKDILLVEPVAPQKHRVMMY